MKSKGYYNKWYYSIKIRFRKNIRRKLKKGYKNSPFSKVILRRILNEHSISRR